MSGKRFVRPSLAHVAVYGMILYLGVYAALTLRGGNLLLFLGLLVLFMLALPLSTSWLRRRRVTFLGGVTLEICLAFGLMLLSPSPSTTAILYFVLVPSAGQLPRRPAGAAYILAFASMVLAFFMKGSIPGDFPAILPFLPGYVAIVAFAESYRRVKELGEESRNLLEELIASQEKARVVPVPIVSSEAVHLSRREREILTLIAKGLSNKEIAARLFLAEGTIKNRVSEILQKTGVRDRTQAALRARDLGIL